VSGKEEFLIINRATGLHLTCAGEYHQKRLHDIFGIETDATAEGQKQAPLTVTHDSPTFYRCRWSIAPTRNNTGAYLSVIRQIFRIASLGILS